MTQKVVRAAARIAAGSQETLHLGNLDIHRDWGWAPEYVEAMWLMLQQELPRDFVIATGTTVSLEYFVEQCFRHFGLDWRAHTRHDNGLMRPSDIRYGCANASMALVELEWEARVRVDDVIRRLCEAVLASSIPLQD